MADLNPTPEPRPIETGVAQPQTQAAPDAQAGPNGAEAQETGRPAAPGVPFRLPERISWGGLLFDLVLIALIVAGVAFRFSWTNWNQDADLHPDEYGLTGTITQLRVPDSLGDYFNTRISPLSPYQKYDENGQPLPHSAQYPVPDNRMRWGQWPITLIRWTAELTGNTGYGELRLMGRRMSALADTLALGVIFLIGWHLYSRRVGLLAAALSALAVMQIQQSHFMTADNFGVLFAALAMYSAVRAASPKRASPQEQAGAVGVWAWYALFGVFFGMALASRINMLALFGEILVAAVIAYARLREMDRSRDWLLEIGLWLGVAAVVGVITFRVTQPMSFRAEKGDTTFLTLRPNPEWVESMKVAQAESSGLGGGPPGEQWTDRPALVFPFVNMVVWGMGLPLGLLAWLGLGWAAWRTFKGDDHEWKAHLLPLTWAGGYFLFMGTRWVKSVRYFLPIYPFLALFAAWALIEVWKRARRAEVERSEVEGDGHTPRTSVLGPRTLASGVLIFAILASTLAWAWGFTGIYRADNTRIQASRWIYQNVPAPFNLHLETVNGLYTEPLPAAFGTQIFAETPYFIPFQSRVTGRVTGFTVAHARNVFGDPIPGTLRVVLAADPEGARVLAQADVPIAPVGDDPRGGTFSAPLEPVNLTAGDHYYLFISAPAGGPLEVSGSTVANEAWDEYLPSRIDGRDAFGGLYSGLTMEVRWGDDENKRQMFLERLAEVDYIFLPSQRGVWSTSRLPMVYPMTMEYYRALFDGRLGFDLVAQFQTPIRIGPLQISDIAGTLAWGRPPDLPARGESFPFNDSLLAAEEAFSVYDHAPVWIFRKRPDFSLAQARAVLEAVDLSQVVNIGPREATAAPTLLRLPPDQLAEQRAGGTWSEMFDADGLLNRSEPLGVVVWWLALLVIGWLAFPLTFVVFGGLADRGYPLAKTVALLVVTWLVWVAGSFRILPFTRGTILLGFGVLAVVSALSLWARRMEIGEFVRSHWRHILIVEGVTLAWFTFDLLIRLGNPDLWHPYFGGEKPMIFSFLNAVLKSTSFPPYNPWLAGHFLNYYYYGFVIVGVLIKLLGLVPAFAYNLILPTLFALTGINAFCVAYNLVQTYSLRFEVRGSRSEELPAEDSSAAPAGPEPIAQSPNLPITQSPNHPVTQSPNLPITQSVAAPPPATRHPSPYIAGLAAALLIVVLGNLGQVYTFILGFQRAADPAAVSRSILGDNELSATLNGLTRVLTGETKIPLGTGDWYWKASRIVTEINQGGSEITEFPFFTFLYADLHAHMIDLPFTVLALAWMVSYLVGRSQRQPVGAAAAMWLIGGLVLGVPRAANTWDFPTFLALGLVTVAAGQWLHDPRITRSNLFDLGWRLVLLGGLAFALYLPFDQWFAGAYSSIKRNLESYAPISAYLYIYGLFLFILVTFLVWETRRWLAETPATVVTEAGDWLPPLVLGFLGLLAGVGVLWYLKVPAGAIALPVMAWAGLLLLRSRQSLSIQKRIVLFLLGTALAITLFVELFALEGDRMNTIFKFYIQVWVLLSVAAGAALAWVWAALPEWKPSWRGGWTAGLALLAGAAALYTVTASAAKIRDRFPPFALGGGCQPIPGIGLPAENYAGDSSLPIEAQPHTLNGLDFMTWSAYCENDYFMPLAYDHDAIRWLQDNVQGSPVIAEAQSFSLYRMSSRYAWNTGLPDVVGWDWHTRQHNAAINTEFVTERGREVSAFYCGGAGLTDDQLSRYPACRDALLYPDLGLDWSLAFLQDYDVRYVIVGPMERADYPPEGLAKFDALVRTGQLSVAYQNPGVTIYEVRPMAAAGQ